MSFRNLGIVMVMIVSSGVLACPSETDDGHSSTTLSGTSASSPASSSSAGGSGGLGGGSGGTGGGSGGTGGGVPCSIVSCPAGGLTKYKTCKPSCPPDGICCLNCGIDKPYPNNVYCDTSEMLCRSPGCTTDQECVDSLAAGYGCLLINGLGECHRECNNGTCVVGECTGIDDNGESYCRPINNKPCNQGGSCKPDHSCQGQICECDSTGACPADFVCTQ
jgi:hypothetical protein